MNWTRRAVDSRHSSRELLANLRCVETYLDSCDRLQPAACYMRDFQSDQHFWSPEVFHWFGLPVAEQAPPMNQFLSLIDPEHLSNMLAAVRRCVEDGSRLVLEYRVRQPGGAVKHLRSIGEPIPSRADHGAAIMGTVFDLTEHHRARAALRKACEMFLRLDSPEGRAQVFRRYDPQSNGGSADRRSADQDGNIGVETARLDGLNGGLSARPFSRVCELIKERLREPLSVAEMAAAAGLSTAHFARAFKQTTGKTPHQFMVEQRLERARLALTRNPDGKLASVAIDFGFFDQSHFTRHFRRKFGITPADFVRQSAL